MLPTLSDYDGEGRFLVEYRCHDCKAYEVFDYQKYEPRITAHGACGYCGSKRWALYREGKVLA